MLRISAFCVSLILLASAGFGQSYSDQVARWSALKSSANALDQLQSSGQWDVAANFRPTIFQELLEHYEGTRVIANTGFGERVGLSAVIDEVSFATGSGIAAGKIGITAQTERPSLSFSFQGTIELAFSKFEEIEDEPNALEAVFAYRVSDVRPNYSFWQRIRRLFGGFVDEATAEIGEMITKRLSERGALEVRVKLPRFLELPLDVDEEDAIEFKKGDGIIGAVNYRLTAPKNTVTREFNYVQPIISDTGISVFATLEDAVPAVSDIAPPSADAIEVEIANLLSKIGSSEVFALNPEDDYEIRVAANVGASLVSELAALPDGQRAVRLQTESANGLLLDLRGRDKNFGKFGIKAHPRGADTLSAAGQLGSLGTHLEAEGLTLVANATATASASVELVWDGFLIKNALSFDISLQGSASSSVRAPLRMVTHTAAGLTGVLWGLDFQCTTFAATVSTSDGELFGIIPITYSEIKATFPVTLFDDPNQADLVVSSRPSRILKVPFISAEEQGIQDYLIEADTNFIEYHLVPRSAGYDAGHYVMRGKFGSVAKKIELSKEGDDFFSNGKKLGSDWFLDDERRGFDEAEDKISEFKFPKAAAECPEEATPRLEVVGLDFGPEGEVVKFINAGLTSEEQKLEAYKSLLEGDLEGAGEHLVNSLQAQVEVAEAAISAAQKALEEATKIPEKPEDVPIAPGIPGSPTLGDVGKAIGKIFSDVRLKADISRVGEFSKGIGIYKFRYVGHEQFFVGVLAQEVLLNRPEAVSMTDTGFFAVDYDILGIDIETLKLWNKK